MFRGWARRPADAALALLLAPRCVACGEWLLSATSGPVCEACWGEVRFFTVPLCDVCGAPVAGTTRSSSPAGCVLCAREPLRHISRAAALGAHEGSLRRIVHGFKFGRCPTLAAPLARLMRERHPGILAGAEFVVPVPLHGARQRERGFNQAQELARHLGPPVLRPIRRRRRTLPQATLDAGVRQENVRGAFAPARRAGAGFRRPSLAGRRIVLVDDVWTTGATLSACAEVLRDLGAEDVRALAVARAMPRATGLQHTG